MLKSDLILKNIIKDQFINIKTENIEYFEHFNQISNYLQNFLNKQILIICDHNSKTALANELSFFLDNNDFNTNLITLEDNEVFGKLLPDNNAISQINEKISEFNANLILAVGSGVINDLCKKASFDNNINYISFPTAISVNGYSSSFASIYDSKFQESNKKSTKCHLPIAIFCHLPCLANSPKIMTMSGISDALCIKTCWADWLMSHLLFSSYYDETLYKWVSDTIEEYELFKFAINGQYEPIRALMNISLIAGFSMHLSGGSHPYSQSEHSLAHQIEKEDSKFAKILHGQQVNLTRIFMNKLQNNILSDNNFQFQFHNQQTKLEGEFYQHKTNLFKNLSFNIIEFKNQFQEQYLTKSQIEIIDSVESDCLIDDSFSFNYKIEDYIEKAIFSRDRTGFLDLAFFSNTPIKC